MVDVPTRTSAKGSHHNTTTRRRKVTEPTTSPRKGRQVPSKRGQSVPPQPIRRKETQPVRIDEPLPIAEPFQKELQASYTSRTHREYPINDFVASIWRYKPEQIPKRRGGYTLPHKLCNLYGHSLNTRDRVHGSSAVLKGIFDHLLGQLRSPQSFSFQYTQDSPLSRVRGTFAPTFAWTTTENPKLHKWEWFGLTGDLSKTENRDYQFGKDIRVNLSLLDPNHGHPDYHHPMVTRKRRRCYEASAPSKRPRLDAEPPEPRVTFDSVPLNDEELHCAASAIESLSTAARLYKTGISIRETTVKLWYADRMGMVFSKSFDFLAEPHLLLLVLAAIASANLIKLGVCPFVKFPDDTRYDSYSGSNVELLCSHNDDGDDLPELQFRFDDTRKVHVAYGGVGRGTTVFPVQPLDFAKTMFDDDLVVKTAWISTRRSAEDMTIRVIRRKLRQDAPDILQHVSDMKCSIAQTTQGTGLPRAFMSELSPLREERVFRTIVLKAYEPLSAVQSGAEFKVILVDAVRAHHYVWDVAGVLHRDVSISNVMFYRKNGRVIGVLSDWDIARLRSDIEDDERKDIRLREEADAKAAASGPENRRSRKKVVRDIAGTIPFVAIDLLKKEGTPIHTYRHDLESFFWLLVWFCVCHDPENRRMGRIREWETGELNEVAELKVKFVNDEGNIYQKMTPTDYPEYREIMEGWGTQLRLLLMEARTAEMEEDFQRATGKRMENAEELKTLNYSNFMACLDVTVDDEDDSSLSSLSSYDG